MRIISGQLRGRRLATPDGRKTRPTSNQNREAIFNTLSHAEWAPSLDGAIVADIFAGSGALGFEALSRGANFCLFVETEPSARAAIRKNIEAMNLFGVTRLHRHDATKLKIAPGNLRGAFSHIFIDPPYGKNLWAPVLERLKYYKLITDKTIIILEEAADLLIAPKGYDIKLQKQAGSTQISYLQMD